MSEGDTSRVIQNIFQDKTPRSLWEATRLSKAGYSRRIDGDKRPPAGFPNAVASSPKTLNTCTPARTSFEAAQRRRDRREELKSDADTFGQSQIDHDRSQMFPGHHIVKCTIHKLGGFQYEPFITSPAGHLRAVEVFQQWDGILSRDAREVFERGNVDQAVGFVLRGVIDETGF